jgi:hypothetical protein
MADDFNTTYAGLANDIADRTGLHPATVLGIIDTETGHGVHVSGNNIFGISPVGPDGRQTVAGYPDVQTASNAFISLLQQPRYAGVAAAGDPASQAAALVKAGYNTVNPKYAANVTSNAQNSIKQLGYQDSSNADGPPAPADPTKDQITQELSAGPSSATPSIAQPADDPTKAEISAELGNPPAPEKPPAASGTTSGDLSGGYISPTGDYVPPQAIPGVTPSPTAQPVAPQLPAANAQPAQPPANTFWAPGGRDIVAKSGWLGRNVLAPAGDIIGETGATVGQAVRGAQGLAANVLTPIIGPEGARDIAALPEAFPLAGRELGAPNALATPSLADVRQGVRNLATEPWRTDPVTGELKPPPTPPGAAPAAGAIPTTSAEALPIATALLDKARASGADLHPDYVNKFIDKVTADAEPEGPGTAAVSGPNDPVAAMVQRLQALRDQPLNIKDVMGMDQALNAQRRAAIKADPDLARRLGDLQDSLRDQVGAATEADVGGGAEGWNAFKDGRAAYSQYKKMEAVEDMKERADGTQNPTSSYKTAVNNFKNGPKARGWSDDEIASLEDSANRGVIGGTLHALGSRLIPLVAGGVGLTKYGVLGALGTTVGAHYMGEMVRNVGNALQTQRFNRTMNVLGSRVPPPPNPLNAGTP